MPALNRSKLSDSAKIFIIAAIALIYCPFFYLDVIGQGYVGDTLIQIRIGLDMLSQKRLILDDIYSWHTGLNWYAHEEGWYFLTGLSYKLFGIAGVIGLTAVFNYTIAGIIFKKNLKTVDPYVMILVAACAVFFTFPNYNARPHLVSELIFVIFIYAMTDDDVSVKRRCILFPFFCFILSWFHGGMVPLFFVIFMVFIIIEAVYKDFRTCGKYLLAMIFGFAAALLNPLGIKVFTYAYLQSRNGSDYWAFNLEWDPKTFSIPEITLLLLFFAGFAADERFRKFNKATITKFCFYSMFIILSCRHCRFMNYTALIIAMFMGEELQILLNWLNENITHFDAGKFKLHDISYKILASLCAVFTVFTVVTQWISYFPTNTVSDISALAAYDEGVIDLLNRRQYHKVYNSFNTGTWLSFYGIPVHIDNRADLYMAEFSGEDHIRGQMMIEDMESLDAFVERYDPDAAVFELLPGTTDEYFIDDLYESHRYHVVYDNTLTSVRDDSVAYRWIVAEVEQ